MTHAHEIQQRGGRVAGLDGMSCLTADTPGNTHSTVANQALFTARRKYFIRAYGSDRVARLHELGLPALFHFIAEIESGADVAAKFAEYSTLPAEFIAALGGSRFPPAIRVIGGGR